MERAHHATSSSALRAAIGAPLPGSRRVFGTARLVALAALVALVVGCGTASVTAAPSGPTAVVSGSASSSLPAPTGSAVPSATVSPSAPPYDASIGGIYQLASWELTLTDSVRLVIVAPQPGAKKPRLDFVSEPGRLDIMLRDIRPVEAGEAGVAGSSGIIARARLVFPPDDSLSILRLTLREGSDANGLVVGRGVRRLSPTAWAYTVTVKKATP